MRFAVDAHAIGRHLTGNEVYIRSLLGAFAEVDRHSEFVAYLSAPGAERWVPERFRIRHVSANPYARLGWGLARWIRADSPDLIHVQYTAPLLVGIPTVVTVHDVSFIEHPEYFTGTRRSQLRLTVGRTVRRAARILTVSEFSRDAILRAYDIPAEKVRVIPNAANPEFRVVGREKAQAAVRDRLGFDAPFIFSVGDLQPRKNQIGLIAAFSKLLTECPQLTHHLVLTGKETWFTPKVREAARACGFASRIHFTGFVSDENLLELYNACDCFVFPSFYEGFGLPILEAMACGRAVACSNTSSMPEVADGAGLLFDPYQTPEITRALKDILLDAELRGRMERLGLQRAAAFTWKKSARATLDVYKEVVNATRQAAPRKNRAATAAAGGRKR
ncbi:MAG TPA: glycosyltransferase family 1 protein [Bryobacteraceae bacterium]|jgi:glycosyltransferase involved in cell wall biosynthesis|nr:glycosyltransferase family 1 protein [Bryobacteraceae bacterium]